MDPQTVATLAEIRAKILESAVMLDSDFTKEEVLECLIEIAEQLNNFQTIIRRVDCMDPLVAIVMSLGTLFLGMMIGSFWSDERGQRNEHRE